MNLLRNIGIFVFGILVGYGLSQIKPSSDSTMSGGLDTNTPLTEIKRVNEDTSIATNAAGNVDSKNKVKLPNTQSSPATNLAASDLDSSPNPVRSSITQSQTALPSLDSKSASIDDHDSQVFSEWQSARKEELFELISNLKDTEARDFIATKVINENPFLTESNARQSELDDEIWAMQMQQDLYMLFNTQQDVASGAVQIDSLVCKQLVCEIVAKEQVPRTWMNVYINVMKLLIERGEKLDTTSPHNYEFNFDNDSFIYNQFVFII